MPRFHLNIFNDQDVFDEEGADFSDLASAEQAAVRGARDLIAEHVKSGRPINLAHHIEVTDDRGNRLAVIPFRDTVTLTDG